MYRRYSPSMYAKPYLRRSATNGRMGAVSRPKRSTTASSTIISHTEYVRDLVSGPPTGAVGTPSVFATNVFSINPGDDTLFPWLATVARNYQTYRFRKLIVKYVTESGIYNTTSTNLGCVMSVIQYDAQDTPIMNKQQMLNYDGSRSVVPTQNLDLYVDVSRGRLPDEHRYIRNGLQSLGGDVKTFDLGKITLASQGTPSANTPLGEIHIEYVVELFQPVQQPAAAIVDTGFYITQSVPALIGGTSGTGTDPPGDGTSQTDFFQWIASQYTTPVSTIPSLIANWRSNSGVDSDSNLAIVLGSPKALPNVVGLDRRTVYFGDPLMSGRFYQMQVFGSFTFQSAGVQPNGTFAAPGSEAHSGIIPITDWLNFDGNLQYAFSGTIQRPTPITAGYPASSESGWQITIYFRVPAIGEIIVDNHPTAPNPLNGQVCTESMFLNGQMFLKLTESSVMQPEWNNWTTAVSISEINGIFQ